MSYPEHAPRRAVTRPVHLSRAEMAVHGVLILCTFGLWLPFYLARKRSVKGKTVTTYE